MVTLPPSTILKAPCKVNLGLKLVGRLTNGYHLLDSFFIKLEHPYDLLVLEQGADKGLSLVVEGANLDTKHNTLTKVYALLQSRGFLLPDLKLTLKKGIPLGAGLGGGSSDAATFLNYLNQSLALNLSEDEKISLAKKIGADVPFFLQNSPCRVTGIGEILREATLSCLPCNLLLVCPKISISTVWAYQSYDQMLAQENLAKTQASSLTKQLNPRKYFLSQAGSKDAISWQFANDLEPVVLKAYPMLASLRNELSLLGAFEVGMSGSGSSYFALFAKNDEEKAQKASASLIKQGYQVFLNKLNSVGM